MPHGTTTEILVIEDDKNDVELIQRAFKKHNILNEVKVIMDGGLANDYLFSDGIEHNKPRVIFLDLKLPKMNGMEILEKLKKDDNLKHIPVIILTSSKEDPDVKRCYDLGANSYLVKPVEFEQFVKVVAEAGMYWLVLNEPPA